MALHGCGVLVGLFQRPSNHEQALRLRYLREFGFDLFNQLFALAVYLVLCVKERFPLLVPLGFDGLDMFLACELFLQRGGSRGGAARFPDLTVKFLDLTFQTHFQVIGPAVQLIGLGLKQACIAFGDVSLN